MTLPSHYPQAPVTPLPVAIDYLKLGEESHIIRDTAFGDGNSNPIQPASV
ncbi:hypothetical protein [Pantoea sp. FN0307]